MRTSGGELPHHTDVILMTVLHSMATPRHNTTTHTQNQTHYRLALWTSTLHPNKAREDWNQITKSIIRSTFNWRGLTPYGQLGLINTQPDFIFTPFSLLSDNPQSHPHTLLLGGTSAVSCGERPRSPLVKGWMCLSSATHRFLASGLL